MSVLELFFIALAIEVSIVSIISLASIAFYLWLTMKLKEMFS